jgi:L-aspartate oxidase
VTADPTTAIGCAPDLGRRRALVVGSGIAGLSTALELGHCTVLTRTTLGAGASRWAQGGLAAALGPGDSPADHADDTRRASSGLTVDEIVELVTAGAPDRVRWLQRLGTGFDVDDDGMLALGREAGHRARRIVHAGGDATGPAVMHTLVAAIRARPDIEVIEHHQAIDLIRAGDRIVGVTVVGPDGRMEALTAASVVLATGGIGRVFARTTNPAEATGDGLAMALRAGAQVRDPEFVQFHPTALDSPLDPRPLLTEALRGDGATLVDADGHRFLVGLHPDAELAPRDVVARANWARQQRGPIFLDARAIGPAFADRFPTVFASCQAAGIDPRRTPIPVTPAQHYHVGGIETDEHGRASLPGLYACGETASAGLHGANRLASNSLVEGLVLGGRVAAHIVATEDALGAWARPATHEVPAAQPHPGAPEDVRAIEQLRATMWRYGGLVRDEHGLTTALGHLDRLRPALSVGVTGRNLAAVAEVVLRAALGRRESRGGHHRADHPTPGAGPGVHTIVQETDVALTAPDRKVAS